MTPAQREVVNSHLHWVLAPVAVWLVCTSPWVSMFRRFPSQPGFFDYAHVALGLVALLAAGFYLATVTQAGRWKWFYPWAAGESGSMARDFAGVFGGKVPPADGPGLYGAIKGLLLLALLATALTGAGWFVAQGTDAAVALRAWHALAARACIAALVLHVLAVASHLLELLRD